MRAWSSRFIKVLYFGPISAPELDILSSFDNEGFGTKTKIKSTKLNFVSIKEIVKKRDLPGMLGVDT